MRGPAQFTSCSLSSILAALVLILAPACDKKASKSPTQTPADPARQSRSTSPEAIAAPPPQDENKLAEGEACSNGSQCQSGICEGKGCDDGALGTCRSESRPCTYDLVPYCGCDAKTFHGSGVCPGRRYQREGACEDTETGDSAGSPE